MKIFNSFQNTFLANQVVVADTFFSRFVGLLNRKNLNSGEALMITRCRSIHMFFMRFAIDVIFVDRQNRVVGLVEGIKPFCLSSIFLKASYAIELPEGTIKTSKTVVGDELQVIP